MSDELALESNAETLKTRIAERLHYAFAGECPAYPGMPSACEPTMCDCLSPWQDMNFDEVVAAACDALALVRAINERRARIDVARAKIPGRSVVVWLKKDGAELAKAGDDVLAAFVALRDHGTAAELPDDERLRSTKWATACARCTSDAGGPLSVKWSYRTCADCRAIAERALGIGATP